MKKLLNKVINCSYKLVLIFTIICFSISLIGAIFFYFNRSYNYFNPIVLIIGSIVYLLLLSKIYKLLIKLSDKKKKIICIILLVLQFILLITSTLIISSVPKVDLIHILTGINSINDTGKLINKSYFSVYPNNKFLLVILYSLQKLIPINSHILFSLISSLSITVMSLFTYKTVTKMFDINKGLLSLFITVLSPIFYLYVSYYYTDILMLPFASIVIYLMVKTKDDESLRSNIIYGILIGILSLIGYKIRAVSIFILVAYFIYIFISKKLIVCIKKIIPIIIGIVLMLGVVKICENNIFKNLDNSKEFPMTHWVMMGVNEKSGGYYNQTDYDFSRRAKDVEKRKELNIKEIKNRLHKMGPLRTGKLLTKKLVVVWSKGDYSYQKYLYLTRDYNKSYSYLIEDKNIVINYVLQFSKISILLLSIIALINLYKRKEKSFIAIALFGAIIFYLAWEVCPRYGLSFLPWLIILGSYSYDSLNYDFNKLKLYNPFKYSLLTTTLIIFLICFNKYTSPDLKNDVVAHDIVNKTRTVSLYKNIDIVQSLKLNGKFNKVKLKFKVPEENKNYLLKFELLDNNKKTVYTKNFDETNIKNNGYVVFKLDKSYKRGIYYIRLSSNSDNKIYTYISYKKEYDYYPEGNLYINNKIQKGDLMFEICNKEKRGIYTYFEYVLIMVGSVVIECIVLFGKKDEADEK